MSQGPFDTAISLARGLVKQPATNAKNSPLQLPDTLGSVALPFRKIVSIVGVDGSPVHVWTVDDATRMHELLDMGVSGIMTDRPTVLREVLIERGQWPTIS